MISKKKILYVITKSNWGGAQRYVFDLAKNLKDTYEITVASGGNGVLFEKLKQEGIQTISIPSLERDIKLWNEQKVVAEILQIIKDQRPDVIHLNSPKAGLLGSITGRIYNFSHKNKICIIQTIHGFPFIEPRSFIWKTIMWIASYASLLLAHKNIFVSQKDIELSKKMPFISSKTVFINNGIAPINFLLKEEARLKLLGEKYDGILVGTIAELNHNKGLEFLIRSFSHLKNEDIKSVIIGDGEKRTELEDLKSELNVPVKLTGQIPGASEYLKAFDIFVLPSLKEGLPYVLLEAGLAGLPVISTTVGGIPHLIQSGISGTLVPPKDPEDLAEAIKSYAENKNLRESHGKELQKIVQEKYNLETTVQKTALLYERK